ncbi:MAG TPA: MFS transporter [Candidatus Bathyarchaeia archaeon]|nr:MFS transporter [Candidatus Bathyarchaeia archaeon]
MNKALKIMLVAGAFSKIAAMMFSPIYAIFIEDIGGGILEAGYAVALYAFATGILMYFFGKKEDLMKEPEIAMVIGYILTGLAYIGYIFVSSFVHLLSIQLILAVASAIGSPAYDGLYSNHLSKGKAASGWGSWEMMASFITGLGALMGGFLVTLNSFDLMFFVMGCFMFIAASVIYFQPRDLL